MTLGRPSNDRYREATHSHNPTGSARRITCAECHEHKSEGQFPLGSNICIRCKPQGPGFRRGGL